MNNPVHQKRSSGSKFFQMPLVQRNRRFFWRHPFSLGMSGIKKVVVRCPAPKFDLPRRTDDPERHSLSTTIGPNGVTRLHHYPHPIDQLHISHRYGFNLHAIAKCPRCFVAGGQHQLDRSGH